MILINIQCVSVGILNTGISIVEMTNLLVNVSIDTDTSTSLNAFNR